MIIAHVAPFSPNRCGLYEAARDMARGDIYGGNDVVFIDAGITIDGKREPGKIGAIDNRGDFKLKTSDPKMLDMADLIIMHTGAPDEWIVRNQTPLIWAVHGRPLACFRPERMNKGNSYSLYWTVANWKRTKGMLYFWEEFKPHWSPYFQGKDIVLPYPVIDNIRFCDDKTGKLQNPGDINLLVCDSEREDIDLYELSVGLLEAVKQFPSLKIHYYGLDMKDNKLPNCWNLLLGEIRKYNGLGDVVGRVADMQKIYNTVDCLISPNRIITRTIGEALTCGCPVISQDNPLNLVSDYTCNMSDVQDVITAISLFIKDKTNNLIDRNDIKKRSQVFNLKSYSDSMNKIYNKLVFNHD